MAVVSEGRVACRTPAEGREGVTNIPAWKFDLIRGHIAEILGDGKPQVYNDVRDAVGARLTAEQARALGKLGWHVITVKLELRGKVERVAAKGPQQIRWAG
ncbi:hypothetical protein [uncultured Roseobacter sp.]|uniref:DUF6958 family protein n=1 Tax=uncultured Roseobacter sp. TaxID=114847 RepID=UPI00262F93D0|nr:hypothetical protein [uncultured Roseobacter sp.]